MLLLAAACTPEDPVVPAEVPVPSNVRLVSAQHTSLSFAWDEVSDADLYVARLETSSGTLIPGGQKNVKELSVTYQELVPGTEYLF